MVCSPAATSPPQKLPAQSFCPFREGSGTASSQFFHRSKCHCRPLTRSTAPLNSWLPARRTQRAWLFPCCLSNPEMIWLCCKQCERGGKDTPKWLKTALGLALGTLVSNPDTDRAYLRELWNRWDFCEQQSAQIDSTHKGNCLR